VTSKKGETYLGFPPVPVVGKRVQKQGRESYIQKEKQITIHQYRIHKIENKVTKRENKHTKVIKNIRRVI
jgi:hypothetical protein